MREAGAAKVYAAGALIVLALVFDVVDGRGRAVAPPGLPARPRAGLAGRRDQLRGRSCVWLRRGPGQSPRSRPAPLLRRLGSAGWRDTTSPPRPCPRKTGGVTYFEGTPIPTSVLLVLLLLALTGAGRIGDAFPARLTLDRGCRRSPPRAGVRAVGFADDQQDASHPETLNLGRSFRPRRRGGGSAGTDSRASAAREAEVRAGRPGRSGRARPGSGWRSPAPAFSAT